MQVWRGRGALCPASQRKDKISNISTVASTDRWERLEEKVLPHGGWGRGIWFLQIGVAGADASDEVLPLFFPKDQYEIMMGRVDG